MADFKVAEFKGIRPGRSALKLPQGEAQTAENAQLGSGDLEPWDDVGTAVALKNLYYNRTIHKFDNGGSPLWFEWNSYVDVARGSVKGDELERTYYTGDGRPKMTYTTIANTGSGPYPATYRRLGVPAPLVQPTVFGTALPESLDSSLRRAISGTLKTKKLEIVFANFATYPGTGSPTAEWTTTAGGQIAFDLQIGDAARVIEVIDEDTVKLGSATGTGAFAATAANDTSDTDFYNAGLDNTGSTRVTDFIGWRIPDGLEATITGHLLRVGDVIRMTRVDYSSGLLHTISIGDDFYEQDWPSAVQVTVDGSTFYQVSNSVVGANAAITADFPALLGGFYYDVDRSASDASILEDRSYVYTFVSDLGEEGPPSPPSSVVNALDGDTVIISGMEAPTTFFRNITKIRIYRTSSTFAGTEFQFVKEIDVATSTSEAVVAAELGEILATTTWGPPPETMQGITTMPNGMMVGFVGKTVHMCEPYFPHAWPAEYDQAIDYEIVGMAAVGNSVAVLTEGIPYILTGSHPRNANLRPLKVNQACVSKESIASTKDRVMYASPDGLVEISGNGVTIATEDYFGKEEWAAYAPTTIVGEIHDGKYFGFFDGPDNVTQPPASVALTGTVLTEGVTLYETDIIAGSKTIVLTLTSDTWVAAGATFNAQRQNIINGLIAAAGFYTGWNAAVLVNIPVTDVVRTNSTVVTITLSARAEYSITAFETVTCTVPASALVTSEVALLAAETFSIYPLQNYSSIAIAFAEFDDGVTDLAFAVSANKDITDWDSYSGIGKLATHEITPTDAVYSPSRDRWLVVSNNGAGASAYPNTHNVCTSDDDGAVWTARTDFYPLTTGRGLNACTWHPNYNLFIIVGDNKVIQASADGTVWIPIFSDAIVPATSDIIDVVIASFESPYIYAALDDALYLLRSPNLDVLGVWNTWAAIAITYTTAAGSKLMASGDGAIISIGANDTNMEVARTVHGAASGSAVGSIATYNCVGLTYGNDTWVAVSNDFRIITCGGEGDSGTIGNWSAPSVSKAANVTISGIKYDQGDSFTQAFGFIAYGINTSSGLGVIYTSPDAVTWTLRHTQTESVGMTALAVKYPETQLSSSLLSFSPTYNGAQEPTLIGDSYGQSVADFATVAYAWAGTEIVVAPETGDAVISIVGWTQIQESPDTDPGNASYAQAAVDLFNLNEEPDEIRITLLEQDLTDPRGALEHPASGHAVVDVPYAPFIDGAFAVRSIPFKYGYEAVARTGVYYAPAYDQDVTMTAIITVQFTFRKAGYNDLSVAYKVQASAYSEVTPP